MKNQIDLIMEELDRGSVYEEFVPGELTAGPTHCVPIFSQAFLLSTLRSALETLGEQLRSRAVRIEVQAAGTSEQGVDEFHVVVYAVVSNVHWINTLKFCEAASVPYVWDSRSWISVPVGAAAGVPCGRVGWADRAQLLGATPIQTNSAWSDSLRNPARVQELQYRATLLPAGLEVPGLPKLPHRRIRQSMVTFPL